MTELTRAEKNVFGEHAQRDEETGEIIETGIGADHARTRAEQKRRADETAAELAALIGRAETAERLAAEHEAAHQSEIAAHAATLERAEKAEAELAALKAAQPQQEHNDGH